MNNTDLIGPYKIVAKAGEGAFGKVWKGKHTDTGEIRAIKEIAKTKITPELMENLLREVQISANLDHENIAKCYDTLESTRNYYIINEYCDGGDLENFIKKQKKLNIKDSLFIMKQLRDVFKYLIDNKILHRDIKPENILMDKEGSLKVKLTDFGCSKDSMMGNTVIGTPKYMALEVLDGEGSYDYKADMWSFGLVFWTLVFGADSFPFSFKNRVEFKKDVKKYSGDNLRFPKFPIYPKAFYDFFRTVLNLSPAMRPEAEEFFNHPIFKYKGDEPDLIESMEGANMMEESMEHSNYFQSMKKMSTKESNLSEIDLAKLNLADPDDDAISRVKKAYKFKKLEVTLIVGVGEDMLKILDEEWENSFFSTYCCLVIAIFKKASSKNDVILKTLTKQSNALKIDGFEEFIQETEIVDKMILSLKELKNKIKKLDNDVFGRLVKFTKTPELIEDVNQLFYKKSSSSDRNKFVNKKWKSVCSQYEEFIPDFEQELFKKIVNRTEYILKGKVADNISAFY